MTEKDLLKIIKKAILEKKGERVEIIDVKKLTPFANYYVICSGMNYRQLDAIKESMVEELEKNKVALNHIEGRAKSGWILVDVNSIIINIFSREERERLKLDVFLTRKN